MQGLVSVPERDHPPDAYTNDDYCQQFVARDTPEAITVRFAPP